MPHILFHVSYLVTFILKISSFPFFQNIISNFISPLNSYLFSQYNDLYIQINNYIILNYNIYIYCNKINNYALPISKYLQYVQ